METKKQDEYIFVNYPEQRTREDYADAMKKIVELHKGMKEVIALFRFGSISAPGISDIDYFIVTKEEDLNFRYKCPHDKLTEREKYLFQHYPSAILPQSLLPKLHLLAPFFEIECIYQREGYNLDTPSIEITKEEALIFLADVIFMAYPKIVVCLREKKSIDIRQALTVLYALRYPIALLKRIGMRKKIWEEFIKEGELLRKDWFRQHQREQQIVYLLEKAVHIVMDIIVTFDTFCENKKMNKENKNVMWKSRTVSVRFEEKYDRMRALNEIESSYAKKKTVVSILPQSIASHLQEYGTQENSFGKYVRRHLVGSQKVQTNNCSLVRKERAEAMSALLEYTTRIKYRRGAFTPFNLGYLDHVGYFNQIRELFWLIFKENYF